MDIETATFAECVQAARDAEEARRFDAALFAWEKIRLRFPAAPAGYSGAGAALRDLLMQFESLGDSCEFGMVQRRFGAEPIGLLRWTSTPLPQLVLALDSDFAGVGEAEHTIITVSEQGEYTTMDRRYHMNSHTFTLATAEPIARFTAQHLRRMQYLRRKLLDDLATGDKIFVYKSERGVSDDEGRELFAAIRRHGGHAALLCVRLETEEHPRGTLTRLEDGLFIGHIDRFSTVDIHVDAWTDLCRQTRALASTRTLDPRAFDLLKS